MVVAGKDRGLVAGSGGDGSGGGMSVPSVRGVCWSWRAGSWKVKVEVVVFAGLGVWTAMAAWGWGKPPGLRGLSVDG